MPQRRRRGEDTDWEIDHKAGVEEKLSQAELKVDVVDEKMKVAEEVVKKTKTELEKIAKDIPPQI